MQPTTELDELLDPPILLQKPERSEPPARQVRPEETPADEPQQCLKLALARLGDYIRTSLAEPDAETAMLGACNASLMRMVLRLEEAMEDVREERPIDADQRQVLASGIEMGLRLTRQVDRFAQLRQALKEAAKATARLTHD